MPLRLKDLMRGLAGVPVVTTGPYLPDTEELTGLALNVSPVDGSGAAISPTNPLPVTGSNGVPLAGAQPLGYQQITSLAVSTALTVPADAKIAVVIAEGNSVRWRDDGVAPTALIGMPLPIASILNYDGDLDAIRFIQTAATASINVSYYG